ncbi:MAG: hypothetical protein ACI4PO_09035 [Faecousia sp.]
MATKLKNMRLTSVDLVPAGANQEADICLYKGLDDDQKETSLKEAQAASRTISKSDPNRFDHIEEFP